MSAHVVDFDPGSPFVGESGTQRKQRKNRTSRGGLAFGCAVCGLILAALFWAARGRPQTEVERKPPPVVAPWAEITHPLALFDLVSPLVGANPPRYEAWRATTGGGRKDALTFGAFADEGTYFRLTIEQMKPDKPPAPFYSDLARQAALVGLFVERSEVPLAQASRFGALSIADATLAAGHRRRSCLVFRGEDPAVRISGIGCGAAADPFDRATLACVLDRLDLIGGESQAPTTRFFERSELARGRGCRTSDRTRASWLDPGEPLPDLEVDSHPLRPIRDARAKDL